MTLRYQVYTNPFRPELLHPFASVIDSPELVDSEPMVGLFQ
jgi:hypothetical protein